MWSIRLVYYATNKGIKNRYFQPKYSEVKFTVYKTINQPYYDAEILLETDVF